MKRRFTEKVVALAVLSTVASGPTLASATETISVGTFSTQDSWSGKWAPQLNYCTAKTDVNLNYVYIPSTQYSEKVLLMAAIGDMPDLLLVPPEKVASVVGAGLLEDVQPWITKTRLDQRTWFPPAINSTKFGGITIGLPAYVINYTYAYNKEILADRGLAAPKPDTWVTWQQVWDTAKKATLDKDGDGTPEIWGFFNNTTFVQVLAIIRQAGGQVYNQKGMVELNSQPVRDAVNFTVDLINEKLHAPSSALFTDGKMATIRLGSGNTASVLAQKNKMSVGVAAGIMNKAKSDVSYITTWSLPVSSQRKDAAWWFMSCMVSRESQGFVAARGVVPMRRDAAIDDEHKELLTGLINNLEWSESYPYHLENEYVQNAFDTAMKPVWTGKASATSVLESLDRTINAYLQEKLK